MKTTFIYALKELKAGEFFSTKIRYIGKSDDPYGRFGDHLTFKGKTHLGCWIRNLPAKELSLQLEILDEVPDLEWEFWEQEYIKVFRAIGFDLVNKTDGGGGFRGLGPVTAETRIKMRAAKLGKKRSPEACAKISAALRVRVRTPEFGAKISSSRKNKKTKNNRSGFVGVSKHAGTGKWFVNFRADRKQHYVGLFSKLEDAVFARALAMDKYFSL